MVKGVKVGERIRRLRESLGMTQVAFGNHFSVTQSRISEWEGDGPTGPSVEAWMKMADLALRTDPAEALLFWEQTGIDSRFLISLADAMLRTGEPKAERILPAAESILRARLGDEEALKAQGKVVLVPPYTEGAWETQESLPPLLVDADMVPHIASTYYLRLPEGDWIPEKRKRIPGNWVIFDRAGVAARGVKQYLNQTVLINLTGRVAHGFQPGLYLGRLRVEAAGHHQRDVILEPPNEFKYNLHVGSGIVKLASFNPEHYLPADIRKHWRGAIEPPQRQAEYYEAVHAAEQDAFSSLPFPEGCEIMGRVIALFSGE